MSLDLSLYKIEDDLLSLIQMREQAVAEHDSLSFGTPEALEAARAELAEQIKVIDQQITEYIRAEVRKVDNIGAFWRHCELMHEAAAEEAKRLSELSRSWKVRLDRMKESVKAAMESFEWRAGKPRVREGRLAKLYLKANGGKQAVEIHDASLVPDEYQTVTVTMPANAWHWLLLVCHRESLKASAPVPSLSLIAAALEKPCIQCGGEGGGMIDGPGSVKIICGACGGSGKQGVPGARLADRGSHVELR
jgi:hypothetical protein